MQNMPLSSHLQLTTTTLLQLALLEPSTLMHTALLPVANQALHIKGMLICTRLCGEYAGRSRQSHGKRSCRFLQRSLPEDSSHCILANLLPLHGWQQKRAAQL